ncbi:MAG: AAA family ATPase, partial [Thermodesulfobacteriota bacterium]
ADAAGLEGRLEEAADWVRELAGRLEAAREVGQETSMEMSSLAERLQNAEREAARTTQWRDELEAQAAARREELEAARAELDLLTERRRAVAERLEGFAERLAAAEDEVSRRRQVVDELRAVANEKENEARQARRRRSELDEGVRKWELDLQELNFRRSSILERIENEYRLNAADLPEEERPRVAPDFEPEAAARQRNELRSAIEGLGEVNLTAIGEHDALLERYNFYHTQYEDLSGAVKNLRDSIARINRTCKIRFNSTFEAVDKKLREIFPLLFDGGEAWLSLTDETDPLESGVEIHVHPPGKKLTVMSLLSGGEKALVALALIFALYLIKPSPFCLLDETDAPLDEANIDRFNRLLKKLGQSSQIIMVTHNKRTMQISETLYGVTMEEPGISKMVSVSLSELEAMEENEKLVQAG